MSDDFVKTVHARFVSKRPKSEKLHKEAQQFLPGGDTRASSFYRPFPAYMERGEGCRVHDVDGHTYIDFMNNYTSLIHGHAHPKVVEALTEQVRRGTVFGSPVECQTELAQEICERLPSAERVRFCCSGTEATMMAIRLARASRRRHKIIKMEGGYQGAYDLGYISIYPPLEKAGSIERPNSVPEDASVPPSTAEDCIIVPYNNARITEQIIADNHEDLAAIIVEPMQGAAGMVAAEPDFLRALRDVSSRYGIPLIFDEVITFRLARGGCQEIHDVVPDLTTLGKIVGGGLPGAAVAGRAELVDISSPYTAGGVSISGTLHGNPASTVAGLATLRALTISEIDRINRLGEQLRNKFSSVLEEVGVNVQLTGMGSLTQFHFTDQEVTDWRSAATERVDIRAILQLLFLDRGIYVAPRNMFSISTPMGEDEIDEAVAALKSSLLEMRPYIKREAPELIMD
jgi:glutamate-1-semialdehyde 2,1-aminomutase